MYKKIFFLVSSLLFCVGLWAQQEPAVELRATWVASVSNIDWPKAAHKNQPDKQKQELIRMLDLYKSINMNAVFLQVRPECDALYNSAYEPWSRFLSTNQGDDPGYDPLAFAIEEAHKRGIELHAWVNPYRINASTSDAGEYYHQTHIFKEHPEWAIEYSSGKKILNPGRPEVMSYIGNVVRDLVSNYSVDGVHFDDYFYAYGGTDNSLDQVEFDAYGEGMSRSDWRRNNVNRMIDTVYRVIQEVNPMVRFGVSPFGIYKSGTPAGTYGMNAYEEIYCDPLAWLENGSVDYLTPQLYWPTGGGQDFEALVNWWAEQVNGHQRHLFPGHGTYRLSDNPGTKSGVRVFPEIDEAKEYCNANLSSMEQRLRDPSDPVAAWTLDQVRLQIDLMRRNYDKGARGSVFFSASDFDRVTGLADYLNTKSYSHLTTWPEMTWKSNEVVAVPQNVRLVASAAGDSLVWDYNFDNIYRFAVYASADDLSNEQIIENPYNLLHLGYSNSILLDNLSLMVGAKVVVVAINQAGKQSSPSKVLEMSTDLPHVNLLTPINGATVAKTDELVWSKGGDDYQYKLQVSSKENFAILEAETLWGTDTTYSLAELALEGEQNYYWRVKAKSSSEGPYSGAKTFITGYPIAPEIVSPGNLADKISTSPKIKWIASQASDNIIVQVAEKSTFETIAVQAEFNASEGEGILGDELEKNTMYYLRLVAKNSYGQSNYSKMHIFTTTAGQIPDVIIEEPLDGITVASFDSLKWSTSVDEVVEYKLQVGLESDFSNPIISTNWMSLDRVAIKELNLEGQRTYYWRVSAQSEFGESDFSEVISFFTGYPSKAKVIAPANLSSDNYINPRIVWDADSFTQSIFYEISQDNKFSEIELSGEFNAQSDYGVPAEYLKEDTWYYLRVRGVNEYGKGQCSNLVTFSTGSQVTVQDKSVEEKIFLYPTVISKQSRVLYCHTEEKDNFLIKILNISGKITYVRENFVSFVGENVIHIPNYAFPEDGLYIIEFSSNKNISKNLLIVH